MLVISGSIHDYVDGRSVLNLSPEMETLWANDSDRALLRALEDFRIPQPEDSCLVATTFWAHREWIDVAGETRIRLERGDDTVHFWLILRKLCSPQAKCIGSVGWMANFVKISPDHYTLRNDLHDFWYHNMTRQMEHVVEEQRIEMRRQYNAAMDAASVFHTFTKLADAMPRARVLGIEK